MVALGPRGAGKTALVNALEESFTGHVPRVLLDFEKYPDARPHEVFSKLAVGLSRHCPQFGRLPFPLVSLCAAVVARKTGTGAGARVGDELRAVIDEVSPTVGFATRMGDLARRVTEAGTVPELGGAVDVLVKLIAAAEGRRLSNRFRTTGAGDAQSVLSDLMTAIGDGVDDDAVDTTFGKAFFADLRYAFAGWVNSARRSANCLVLLDNTHVRSGQAFLGVLHRVRSEDPVAFVATSREWNASWRDGWQRPGIADERGTTLSPPRRPDQVAGDSTDPERLSAHWYLVLLGEFTEQDTAEVAASHASFVHRLTGGLPWAVRRVASALPESPTTANLRSVLDGLAEECTEYLLREFGSLTERDDLITASAGPGIELLADTKVLGSEMSYGLHELKAPLVNNFWVRRQDGRLVLNPWLRRVLLHQLAARPADHRASWNRVHTQCRVRHEKHDSQVDALYHGLALGDIEAVVAHLSGPLDADEVLFDEDAGREWLQDLDAITAAPNRLTADADPRDQVEQLIGTARHAKNSRALSRLVAAQWLYGDPLADPLRTLRQTIATALDHIAIQVHGAGTLALQDRAEAYRKGLL
ncbi:hypothetical protein OG205_20380 [Lentzea sp. NBC_00516]|uniref:hypothetical protein n=1 Tax=Lentzea sp. NBC_00516 TaxID=2903582 RepID=UPI002E81B9E5|nr:hypothetical protein [Lentzea sp. NBC_00516]WUD29277.1 hypothetical protein OG205_20380 [Lentzea sp. NBC_00516]